MRKLRQSIKKRSNLIFLTMAVLFVAFLVCMILVLGNYRKTMNFYSKEYTALTGFIEDINAYNIAMEEYSYFGQEQYREKAQSTYAAAKSSLIRLYNVRHSYNNDICAALERIEEIYSGLQDSMEAMAAYPDPAEMQVFYSSTVKGQIIDIVSLSSGMIASATEQGDRESAAKDNHVVAAIVIMSLAFAGFCAAAVYCIWFIRKRIVYPIVDIAGWAKLFDEGYAEMADLQHGYDDEFSELANSFNIVKREMVAANQLKSENETALQKLRYEEEHKKKFVKQLYEEKREKESISNEAKRDGLTGLYNRQSFDALVQEFMEKKKPGITGALYLVDMDNFKNVNDTLGHIAGDEALKLLAGTLRAVFPGGYLGRYGGDEFVAFLTTGNDDAFRIKATELCNKMSRDFEYGGKSVKISVSVGIVSTEGMEDYSEMYLRVDRALYYAKEHGRNQFKLASELEE